MSWQAQLYIGVPVHSAAEARAMLDRLGVDHTRFDDYDLFLMWDAEGGREVGRETAITFRGTQFTACITPRREREGGTELPVSPTDAYTDAIVGFALTSRYRPAILDQGNESGRPEPFVIDLDAARAILEEIRAFWPEAQLMVWDRHY